MKHLDLFSGIGGFSLAAHWAGFETVGFCEIESYCRQVLKKHWPEVPIHNDVRELDGNEYGSIDLITGGYPCQPFSLAGARKGHDDHRHLWPEMLRVIAQARPTWVVAENVTGHITMGLDTVLTDLESEGYAARAVVIPACGINAPHRRDRVWIMANTQGLHDRRSHTNPNQRQKQKPGNRSCATNVANTNAARPQEREIFARRKSQARSTHERQAAERADWWPTEPGVGRVANGVPSRVDRIKGLGNAIVPQVAFQILKPIAKLLSDP